MSKPREGILRRRRSKKQVNFNDKVLNFTTQTLLPLKTKSAEQKTEDDIEIEQGDLATATHTEAGSHASLDLVPSKLEEALNIASGKRVADPKPIRSRTSDTRTSLELPSNKIDETLKTGSGQGVVQPKQIRPKIGRAHV